MDRLGALPPQKLDLTRIAERNEGRFDELRAFHVIYASTTSG